VFFWVSFSKFNQSLCFFEFLFLNSRAWSITYVRQLNTIRWLVKLMPRLTIYLDFTFSFQTRLNSSFFWFIAFLRETNWQGLHLCS
jgi:hypothetical protein